MKEEGAVRKETAVYRILLATVAFLALVLIGGTLYALVFRAGGAEPPRQPAPQSAAEDGIFTGVGRLRAATAGPEPVTVIVSVVFPYPSDDKPFAEELATQIMNFRNITNEYFVSLSTKELLRKDDASIKAEILRRYNSLLRLGQIETIYFNEYLVIE
ncbi:MAG: flagellar basal body protein FliL [Treponema sp.]|jgi:flagellar basal body-associated protein FliL|nr:flagellar basal body protein FliL [Treponema sp.]